MSGIGFGGTQAGLEGTDTEYDVSILEKWKKASNNTSKVSIEQHISNVKQFDVLARVEGSKNGKVVNGIQYLSEEQARETRFKVAGLAFSPVAKTNDHRGNKRHSISCGTNGAVQVLYPKEIASEVNIGDAIGVELPTKYDANKNNKFVLAPLKNGYKRTQLERSLVRFGLKNSSLKYPQIWNRVKESMRRGGAPRQRRENGDKTLDLLSKDVNASVGYGMCFLRELLAAGLITINQNAMRDDTVAEFYQSRNHVGLSAAQMDGACEALRNRIANDTTLLTALFFELKRPYGIEDDLNKALISFERHPDAQINAQDHTNLKNMIMNQRSRGGGPFKKDVEDFHMLNRADIEERLSQVLGFSLTAGNAEVAKVSVK